MAFDYKQAKQSGYSDQEVQDYLKQTGRNFDVVGAKSSGYSDDEINNYLSASQPSKKESIAKKAGKLALDVGSRVVNAPSQVLGGVLKASRQLNPKLVSKTGDVYQPPKIKEVEIPTLQGKKKIEIGSLIHPGLVGAVRGLKEQSSVMEELPEAAGIKSKSIPGVALGLAGELATPDLADALLATKAAKKVIEPITGLLGKTLKKTGEYVAESGIKPTASQRKVFKNAYKKTIGKFIADKNLAGNISENLANRIDDLQGEFDELALRTDKKVTLKDWLQSFGKSENELSEIIDKKELKALREFRNDLGGVIDESGALSLKDLVEMRRKLDKKIPESKWARLFGGGEVDSNIIKREFLNDVIRRVAGDEVAESGKTLTELGKELSPLYKLKNISDLQEGVTTAGRMGGIGDILAFTAGYNSSEGKNIPEKALKAASAVAARRFVTNPKVLGYSSKALTSSGEALSNPLLRDISTRAIKEPILKLLQTNNNEDQLSE